MKITAEMTIKDVIAVNEEKMINRLIWLAPQFDRLRHPRLRRMMSKRVSVRQAAKIAGLPLTEMLYALNLVAGGDDESLSKELRDSGAEDFNYIEPNLSEMPYQIAGVDEDPERAVFVDLMPYAEAKLDPLPAIVKGLLQLRESKNVLWVKHPFDPIPLREMLARKGFESWARPDKRGAWSIYFFRSTAATIESSGKPASSA